MRIPSKSYQYLSISANASAFRHSHQADHGTLYMKTIVRSIMVKIFVIRTNSNKYHYSFSMPAKSCLNLPIPSNAFTFRNCSQDYYATLYSIIKHPMQIQKKHIKIINAIDLKRAIGIASKIFYHLMCSLQSQSDP